MMKQVCWFIPEYNAKAKPMYRESEANGWKHCKQYPIKMTHKFEVTPGYATWCYLKENGYTNIGRVQGYSD